MNSEDGVAHRYDLTPEQRASAMERAEPILKHMEDNWCGRIQAENKQLRAKVERLQAEVERLREKAEALLNYCYAFGPENLNETELAVLCDALDAALRDETGAK